MKKATTGVTERRHREGSPPADQGISSPSMLSLRLATDTKEVEWEDGVGDSNLVRLLQDQLETYVLATLDSMDVPSSQVALSFRFEPGRITEATLKAIVGGKKQRSIVVALTDALRRMAESGARDASPFPIEILIDTRAATAMSVILEQEKDDSGTIADKLTRVAEVGHGQGMSDVEGPSRNSYPNHRRNPVTSPDDQVGTRLGDAVLPSSFRSVFRRLSPERREQRLLAEIEAYAAEFPDRAKPVADQIMRSAVEKTDPSQIRNLNLAQATRRICVRVGIELDPTQLKRWAQDPKNGIGEEDTSGKFRFSEAECDRFVVPERKMGRPAKK